MSFIVFLMLLAAFPGGQAQVSYGIRSQADSLLPDAKNLAEVATDPAGDVGSPFGLGNEDPTDGTVDLVSVSIAESEDMFLFQVGHRDYDPLMNGVHLANPLFSWYDCGLSFQINSDDTYGYSFYFNLQREMPGSGSFQASGYMWEDRGERSYGEFLGRLPVALIGQEHVEVVFSKDPIRVGKDGRGLQVGDRITDLQTACYRSSGLLLYQFDWIEEGDSAPYKITMASGSDVVSARFAAEDGDSARGLLALPAGTTQKVPIVLQNLRESRLIVNLNATLVDAAGAPKEGWKAVVAPAMEIPGGGDQQATLFITTPADAAHREQATLLVEIAPLGAGDTLTLKRTLSVSVAPSPEQDTLYFHSLPYGFCGICIAGQEFTPIDTDSAYFILNTLEDDPLFGQTTVESEPLRLQGGWYDGQAFLDTPFSRPVRIAADKEMQLAITLSTDVERDVTIEAQIYADGERSLLASGRQDARIGSETTVTLALPTGPDEVLLPKDGYLWMLIDVRETYPGPATPFTEGTSAGIDWVTAKSSLKMPLLPIEEDGYALTDGQSLPTIQLRNGTERDAYVNAGKTHAFDLRLVNEGVRQDKLTVTVTPTDPSWRVEVQPGKRFALEPGQGAPFSVLVTAPEGAQEEETLVINMTATSDNDDRVRTQLALKAVVTVLPLEPNAYTPPPEGDRVDPLKEKSRESPAPLPLALAVFVLGAVAMLRRRR